MIKIVTHKGFLILAKPVQITGVAPFSQNQLVTMTLFPRHTPGYEFCFQDCVVPVNFKHTKPGNGEHTTLIANSQTEIICTEHILSALYGIGVMAATISLSGVNQVPAQDSSASSFIRAIDQAGLAKSAGVVPVAKVIQDIYFSNNDGSSAILRPYDGLRISCLIQFSEPIGEQYFRVSIEQYRKQISWARSFIRSSYNEEMWNRVRQTLPMLPQDVKKSPILVFQDDNWIVKPRVKTEAVRHKILDAIGDLATLGYRLEADITIIRPGHEFNRKLVNYLGTMIEPTTK